MKKNLDSEQLFIIFAVNLCSYCMSPRIKILRKVLSPPAIKGFKPYGEDVKKNKYKVINLHFEEYEALRLCDYDMYNHHQAAQIMEVSRPTFTRIYASVRKKIAKAFVEGLQISIEGGKVYFDSNWYHCNNCNCNFNNPEKNKKISSCPLCSGIRIINFDDEYNINRKNKFYCLSYCICPECGIEQVHQKGQKCNEQICPECQTKMKRKGTQEC